MDSGVDYVEINVAANIPPIACLKAASPTTGDSPLYVKFDGICSDDEDGTVTQYIFYYGEGEGLLTSDTFATHEYETPGTYNAALKVQDNDGAWSAPSQVVTITVNRTEVTSQAEDDTGEAAEEDDAGEEPKEGAEKSAEKSAEKKSAKK